MTKENKMLKAICEGELDLGPIKVKCAVLENKQRVVSQREVVRALTGHAKGGLDRYLRAQNLQEYVPTKFQAHSLDQTTLKYLATNGIEAQAFSATDIVDFLDMYLQARKDKKLLQSQYHLADQAEQIVRSLAKTGIIALIDEATGYEKIRETGELAKFFKETMIRDAASDRTREFEERGVFDGLYKIYKLPRKKDKPWQHPQFFANFFIKYIYKPLDSIITNKKAKTNGIMFHLLREKKNLNSGTVLYQFIHEVGEGKFFEHVAQVSNLMKLAHNKKEFDRLFELSFDDIIQDDLFSESQVLELIEPQKKQEESEEEKIIESIKKDYPKLENEGFEEKLKEVSVNKK